MYRPSTPRIQDTMGGMNYVTAIAVGVGPEILGVTLGLDVVLVHTCHERPATTAHCEVAVCAVDAPGRPPHWVDAVLFSARGFVFKAVPLR